MFEIERNSEMDNTLAKIEKAVYNIRNCVEEKIEVEWQIAEIRNALEAFEIALEVIGD
jgi:chaperonin cofactor prefoldin